MVLKWYIYKDIIPSYSSVLGNLISLEKWTFAFSAILLQQKVHLLPQLMYLFFNVTKIGKSHL